MNRFKMFALLAFAAPFALLAEGEGGASTAVTAMLTESKTTLEGLVTTALPIVSALVVAGLTIWGGFKIVRLIMRAFGFGAAK